jgi:hypothetical protein
MMSFPLNQTWKGGESFMILKVKVAPGTRKPSIPAADGKKSKFGWPC